MPKEMERQLVIKGRAKGLTGNRLKRYIYGTMRKTGWTPSKKGGGKA